MKNWLIGKILGLVGRKLDGYKTKIGGVGLILVGVTGIIAQIFPDQGLPTMDLETSLGSIAAGVAALGLGHKAEKTRAEVARTVAVPAELDVREVTPAEAVKEPLPWNGKTPGQFS
ncbi:MAG: hypothetical protein CVU53_01870 [Deltaproteobacteria bacterium HGW-Deltaproteobacteria-11]|nr:MAG: hypothetical protein CVU53_01870 [Deltaproteobacteria bacterium HGW-Deltaproteobacteria-11]